MHYRFWLPLSAFFAVIVISGLVEFNFLPSGLQLLESLQARFDDYFYILIACIILLESVVYIGFYFPGQFFAVVLVVMAKPQWQDIFYLTLAMVVAATVGSLINFLLGRWLSKGSNQRAPLSLKTLLIAMIHINSLAFFMFFQGANGQKMSVVLLAALLNLPYYLILIFMTSLLSQQVLLLAENIWILAGFIAIWLVITVFIDVRKHRQTKIK